MEYGKASWYYVRDSGIENPLLLDSSTYLAELVKQRDIQTYSPVKPDLERNISPSTDNKTLEQQIQDKDFGGSNDLSGKEKPKPAYKPKLNLINIKHKSEE